MEGFANYNTFSAKLCAVESATQELCGSEGRTVSAKLMRSSKVHQYSQLHENVCVFLHNFLSFRFAKVCNGPP